jgi:hypothetical protein
MKATNKKRKRLTRAEIDAHDLRICEARKNGPWESLESVKRRLDLRRQGGQ